MTLKNVVDGIITNISSASVLGTSGVGKTYDVLKTGIDAAAVVSWNESLVSRSVFGSADESDNTETYLIELFLKDIGSASAIMDNVLDYSDKILASLLSDDTLQGTVKGIPSISATRIPGDLVSNGTLTYLPVDIRVTCLRWPNG